jgi:hypothetical protein
VVVASLLAVLELRFVLAERIIRDIRHIRMALDGAQET